MLKSCLAAAIILPALVASAAAPVPSAVQLDAVIGPNFKADEPGAIVLVASNGRTIFRKAYGLADVASGMPMTDDMRLPLPWVTRDFTATAILMLVQDGKLNLNDNITRFLPDYPPKGQRITIDNLLNNRSGIPGYDTLPGFSDHVAVDVTVDAVIDTFRNAPQVFTSGTRVQDSASDYYLLGAIIEKASGRPYADFLAERIFKPFGMHDTAYEGKERSTVTRPSGYTRSASGFSPSPATSPNRMYANGAVVSTVDDMARWDAAVSSGKLRLPADRRHALLWTAPDAPVPAYAFSWNSGTVRGVKVLENGGAFGGYGAYALRMPSEHLYVLVLRNVGRGGMNPAFVAKKVAALVIGRPYATFPVQGEGPAPSPPPG